MAVALGAIGQIGWLVSDFDKAAAFYGEVPGLRKPFRFGTLGFYDCAGVRLFLDQVKDPKDAESASPIYFRVPDIALARRESNEDFR